MNSKFSLIALVLCFMFFVAIVTLVKKAKPFKKIFISNRIGKIIFIAYVTIFILSVPTMYLLPTTNLVQKNEITNISQYEISEINSNFYKYANEGKLDSVKGIIKNLSKTFISENTNLSFDLVNGNSMYNIWVERKNTDDGEIEVSSYVSPHYANEIDFSQQISPPKLSMTSGVLKIEYLYSQDIKFDNFALDFPLMQFTSKESEQPGFQSSHFGIKAIYVKVPKSMKIENKTDNVIIIEK